MGGKFQGETFRKFYTVDERVMQTEMQCCYFTRSVCEKTNTLTLICAIKARESSQRPFTKNNTKCERHHPGRSSCISAGLYNYADFV